MIGWLRGKVLHIDQENLILECQGVGYEVSVPAPTSRALALHADVALHIYTHVREDQLALYGFEHRDEKRLFLELLSVSGIGARTALAMLSLGDTYALISAIIARDIAFLRTCPGVGQKTAERVAIDLGDRLRKWGVSGAQSVPAPSSASTLQNEAISALINLGYKKSEAEAAVNPLASGAQSFDQLFKASLKQLRSKHT